MADQKLIDEVGRYIDKYYEPVTDDIKMDQEMKSIFDKITKFRKKRAEVRQMNPCRKNLMFQQCRRQSLKKECLLLCQ